MSDLKYFNYPGWGEKKQKEYSYSQAVRVGDRIECSGQGGWKSDTGIIFRDTNKQIDQAFEQVDICLKHAGGKGWSQVFRVNSYHVPLNQEAMDAMIRNYRKWMPNHQPVWTTVGVTRLGADDMRCEIEVVAYDPEGASSA